MSEVPLYTPHPEEWVGRSWGARKPQPLHTPYRFTSLIRNTGG